MEDISKYIRELLFTHDIVSVKGLGSFLTTYKPAGKNPVDNTFSPPAKILQFSKSHDEDNDILIKKIALSKNISYEESQSLIKNYTDDLLEKLDRGEKVHLVDIGYLSKDIHKKIIFEPHHTSNFLADAFGLDEIAVSPLKKHTPAFKKQAAEPQTKNKPEKHRNKSLIYTATSIILIITVALIAYFTGYLKTSFIPGQPTVKNIYKETDKFLQNEDQDNKMKDSLSRIEKKLDELTQKEEALKPALGGKEQKASVKETEKQERNHTLVADNKNYRYYLVAGSFKNFDNAQILVKELTNEGYAAKIYEGENNFYRVVLDSFTLKKEALSAMKHIRGIKGKESVWILYE
ncbi:MAG TPA: SPOR domain-containing protein [Bacteroidales bacterium]|nr:SPOR domain-containing protein [Bacteroidales bacterium]